MGRPVLPAAMSGGKGAAANCCGFWLSRCTQTQCAAARLACRARKLTDEQRSAIAAYFAVYKGQASWAGIAWIPCCQSQCS